MAVRVQIVRVHGQRDFTGRKANLIKKRKKNDEAEIAHTYNNGID